MIKLASVFVIDDSHPPVYFFDNVLFQTMSILFLLVFDITFVIFILDSLSQFARSFMHFLFLNGRLPILVFEIMTLNLVEEVVTISYIRVTDFSWRKDSEWIEVGVNSRSYDLSIDHINGQALYVVFFHSSRICLKLLVVDFSSGILDLSRSLNELRPDILTGHKYKLTGSF
jgi:hypothetical protein